MLLLNVGTDGKSRINNQLLPETILLSRGEHSGICKVPVATREYFREAGVTGEFEE
jgi:hypothetical protein